MSSTKSFCISFVSLVTLCYSCQNKENKESKNLKVKRPNIVFILSDDHAISAISAYKGWLSDVVQTPNIDKIAKNGMLMTAAYVTNSICGPSRASIITGKYSHINGFFKNKDGGDFDGSQVTFPKLFHENGYQTAIVGKWHLGSVPTGFDYSKVMINHQGQGSYFNTVFLENGKDTIVEDEHHSTEQVYLDAVNWLDKKRDSTKPFLLMYQFKAPHRPWEPNKKFESLYKEDLPYPPNFNDDYIGRKAAKQQKMEIANNLNRRDLKVPPKKDLSPKEEAAYYNYGNEGEFWSPNDTLKGQALKEWKYQRFIKDYLRCVAGVDEAVGKMIDYLKAHNLYENTIIVYASDQGFYLGEHGWFDKRWMYEESFRMPFMISYPGVIAPGTVNDNLLLNIDYAPTLLDLAGIPIPEEMQGTSFKDQLLQEPKKQSRNAIYYHYYEYPKWHQVQPHYGIRTKKYKLIHFYYNMDEWELYDLDTDPHEMSNLYGKEGYDQITSNLKRRLEELQEKYKDDMSLDHMRAMTDVKIERAYQN